MRPFLALLVLVLLAAPAAAGTGPKLVEASYRIYVGGLPFADIETRSRVDGGRYRIESRGRSAGLLDLLLSFESTSVGEGRVEAGAIVPHRFSTTGHWRGEPRRLVLDYARDGRPVVHAEPPIDPDEREPVPEPLTLGTTDPLSAVLGKSLAGSPDEVCSGTVKLFNGRVRSNLHLRRIGPDRLKRSHYNVYAGDAQLCELVYEPVAGRLRRPARISLGDPPPFRLWVARLDGADFWTPVKLEGEGAMGLAVAHLVGYRQLRGAASD